VISALLTCQEILRADEVLQSLAPGGIEAGAMKVDQQKAGCVEVLEAGQLVNQRYTSTLRQRVQVNCYAKTEVEVDRMTSRLQELLHHRGRRVVALPDAGVSVLVHWAQIIGGPSMGAAVVEDLKVSVLFLDLFMGTVPVPEAV